MTAHVAVIGAGAYGLALADYLARHGATVRVWDRSAEALEQLRSTRTIERPKGLVVHPAVEYYDTIDEAAGAADFILSAVPSFATRDVCRALAPLSWPGDGAIFVNCSKGIEQESQCLPCQIFQHEIGIRSDLRYAVIAGPSHAEEITKDSPAAVVTAAPLPADAAAVQMLFNSPTFRFYTQADFLGAELGGALKNVIAIAAGVCDGKGYGDNTKAALITRGVAEIARMAEAIGAHRETVAGLSGLGDLIVTAMSKHSRNRGFGELLASGCGAEAALEQIGAVVEGYKTTKSAYELAKKYDVEMPLVTAVYRVLYEGLSIEQGIALLLDRDVKEEKL